MLYHLQSYSSFVTAPILIIIFYHPCILWEVFPGSGRVLGIQVGNNYITLPGEIFEDITESGNGAHDSHAGSSSQNIYNL